jgi:hypothetical protein
MSNTPKNCEVPERRRKGSVEARPLLLSGGVSLIVQGVWIFELVTQLWLVDEVQVVVALLLHELLLTSMTGISEF